MDIAEVFPPNGEPQRNYCDACSAHLELAYSDFDEDVSGVRIRVGGLPVLRCPSCDRDHLPDRSRVLIINLHMDAIKNGQAMVMVRKKKLEKDFGITKVPLLYDPDDHYYIPGLSRQWDDGFLTPVFFNRAVLLKYDNSPDYRVRFASTTYGDIDTGVGSISFGINRHGRVVMWLGDIAKLPEAEQYYLRSENVPSDHSIGSEFYDGQIECVFTEQPAEAVLFGLRSEFVEACFTRFGKKVAHLDDEVVKLAFEFNAPVVDTDKERRHIADALNKIYLESLDNAALGEVLQSLGGKPASLGSLKRLQGILERIAPTVDVASMMSPLYVLYDLRVAYSHLMADKRGQDILETVTMRLGLKTGAGLMEVYGALLQGLSTTFGQLKTVVET